MRRILVLIVFVLLICVGVAHAVEMTGTVKEAYSYRNITTADNTVLGTSRTYLAGINVNGGTMGQIVVYDNTTCSGATIGTIAAPYAGQVIPYGILTNNGLCISTGAAMDVTVVYK